MSTRSLLLFLFFGTALFVNKASAQLVGDQIFLQGRWLEVGVAPNGSWGNTMPVPAGYHAHPWASVALGGYPDPLTGVPEGGDGIDFSSDIGHDGWTTGSPAGTNCCYYGSFFLPGTPFDGWALQMNGTRSDAYYTNGPTGGFGLGAGATLNGTNVDYKYRAGSPCGPYMESTSAGYWAGTYSVGGGTLSVRSTNRVDTNASWDLVNVTFKNTGATPITGLYYLATGDPDNDVTIGGTYSTDNHICYQDDAQHRVEVNALPGLGGHPDDFTGLATKDCRARAIIYRDWPSAVTVPLSDMWAGTTAASAGPYYSTLQETTVNQDIAYGLVYNLGNLAPGDSTRISFAWIFTDSTAIDSAFVQPKCNLNCGIIPDHGDTLNICGMDTVPVNIVHGEWGCTNWVWSPATGLASTTGIENNIIVALVPGTTTYTVTSDDTSSCNHFEFTFTVIKVPPTTTATYNGPLCSGNTLILTSTPDFPGETWLWKGPNGYTSTLSDPTRPFALTSYSGVYTLIATLNGCVDSTTVNVRIDSTPAVPIVSSNSFVCETDTLKLFSNSATAGVTYSWVGPSGFTSTLANPVIPNAPLTANGNYSVTVTLGGCSSRASVLGEVRLKPMPILGSNSPVCTGNPLNLTTTAPPGSTFAWTGPLSYTSTLQYPSINPAITANTGTYSVIVTLNGCSSDMAWITVAVDTTPELPVLTTNSPGPPGATLCEGDTLKFTSFSATIFTMYTWNGPNSFFSTLQNPMILHATALASGVYTLVASIGTCSATATITATITPTPPLTVSSNTPVCSGAADTIKLIATGNPGSTFTWTGPYTFFSNAQNPLRTPVDTEYHGVYHATVLLDGCTNTAATTVVVNPTPPPPWIKWLTYCQYYDADYLQAFGTNVLWYTSSAPGTIGSVVPPKPATDVVGIKFYFTNQTILNCPSAIDSIRVTVNPSPTVTVGPDVTVCPWDSVVLTAVNTDAIAYYHWYPSMYVNDTSAASVIVRPETDMDYSVISSNMYGCTDTATVNVTVKANAVIHIPDSVLLYPGETYQIEPSTNCTWFSWNPSGGLSGKYLSNPVASPEISTKYVVTGVTEWGCKTKDSINVNINGESVITVPNAFAPGTGVNGVFKLIRRGQANLRYFRVYDRWGVVVFQTSNIEEGWDGTYKGTPQPVGVYIYDISAVSVTGKMFSKTGNVTLLR